MQTSVRTGKRKIETGSIRTQEIREHGSRRLALGVAVLRGLDDLRVEAQRRVIDEHSTIDGGQVHMALDAICEGVERTHDVITVQAEVKCEVISGAGRNHHVRKTVTGGDRSDERLGAVAPRHPEDIGASGDRALGEF